MEYDNSAVRRQDRLLEESDALRLLREGEYGILSFCDRDQAYGIPVDYAWDGNASIFIHCAPEGRKLRILEKNSRVSFCVVGPTRVISRMFTTEYESVVAQGTAFRTKTDEEKRLGLELIIDKYSPHDRAIGQKYLEKSFQRTAMIRMDIETLSGKCKKMK